MEPAVLGLVLDSSVLVAAERKKLKTTEVIRKIRESAGDVAIAQLMEESTKARENGERYAQRTAENAAAAVARRARSRA